MGLDEDDKDFNEIGKTGGSKDMQSHYHDIRSMNTEGNGVVASYTGTGDSALSLDNWSWVKTQKDTRTVLQTCIQEQKEQELVETYSHTKLWVICG